VKLVHVVITFAQDSRCGMGGLVPGVRCLAPHAGYEVPHPLDKPPTVRREVLAANMASPGGDLSDEVVRALELGIDDIQLTLKCCRCWGIIKAYWAPLWYSSRR
jgi:hypothetical protein